MSLQQAIKEASELYSDVLLGPEFMDKFYAIFLTLSPSSEKRFEDIEKQKKAFHGMLSMLLKMAEENDVLTKLKQLRRSHEHMKISNGEQVLSVDILRGIRCLL